MTATTTGGGTWIRRFRTADPGAPTLVCLPHSGGSASFYAPMARALAPRCQVLAIQYPGRQDRTHEPLIDSLDELTDQVFPVLRRALAGPVALFGHSMGAVVAFELARRFEAAGAVPTALFVSARRAPSRERGEGRVHRGTDEELLAHTRAFDGTSAELLADEEMLRLALPILRNDYKATETYRYRPGPPLSCPVHALLGDEDPTVTEDDARAWAGHTRGAFTWEAYRGGHFYLRDHQAAVCAAVAARLPATGRDGAHTPSA